MPRSLAIAVALGSCFVLSAFTATSTSGREGPAARAEPAQAARSPLFTGPLETGLVDVTPFLSSEAALNFRRVRAAGTKSVRILIFWRLVAPDGSSRVRPTRFDANDPTSPAYKWGPIDGQIALAARNGLEPIVGIQQAPAWAERGRDGDPGTRSPDPAELAAFARAAARRYSGSFRGLPRVRYWQVWNEPNLSIYLVPQSPDLYRRLVNAVAAAVYGVRGDNRVVAGGLAPFGFKGVATAPFQFMRELLCLSAGANPRPTCNDRINFDIWAHHPYTTGGPTHKAQNPDDASIGDLPQMRRMLDVAVRSGRVVSRAKPRFWVTEFSWDSSPPDPIAVPADLHARWVAEGLYRMWQAGVSQVTWFSLRDEPLEASEFQSGLYLRVGASYSSARPKRSLRAFRFPFVAFPSRGGVFVWGRTPGSLSRPGAVLVERRAGAGWRRVGRLTANRYGIFSRRFGGDLSGPFRARLANGKDTSVPFTLTRPPDIQVWPFGCGGILPCK